MRNVRPRLTDSNELLQAFFQTIYQNPKTHSNGVQQFYEQCQDHNKHNLHFTKQDVEIFLNKQKSFQRFKPPAKTQRQEKVMPVAGRFHKWQADLIDMQRLYQYNDGYRYILTMIDVFSKYAIVVPLKDKTARSISDNLFEIFSVMFKNTPMRPRILQTDNGSEFTAKSTKLVCSLFGIHQIFSFPYSHLGYIERFNLTFKRKLFGWLAVIGSCIITIIPPTNR